MFSAVITPQVAFLCKFDRVWPHDRLFLSCGWCQLPVRCFWMRGFGEHGPFRWVIVLMCFPVNTGREKCHLAYNRLCFPSFSVYGLMNWASYHCFYARESHSDLLFTICSSGSRVTASWYHRPNRPRHSMIHTTVPYEPRLGMTAYASSFNIYIQNLAI
jgi:hypothetical protein